MIALFDLTIYVLQTISSYIYIYFSSRYFSDKKSSFLNELSIIFLCILTSIFYNLILDLGVKEIFVFSSLFLLFVVFKKFKFVKAFIFSFIYTIIDYTVNLLITYFSLSIFNLTIYHYNLNNTLIFLNDILSCSLILCIIVLLNILVVSKLPTIEFLKRLHSRHIFVLLVMFLLTSIPHIVLDVIVDIEFTTEYYGIAALQLVLTSLFTWTYVKIYITQDYLDEKNKILNTDVQTMSEVIDGTRALKHDFNNIFQALHGLALTKNYTELEIYISKLMADCQTLNNFSIINNTTFNDPGIYALVGSKALIANSNSIKFDIDVTLNFKNLGFDKVDFIRVLGVLLDNALEASMQADYKYVLLTGKHDKKKNASIITISNTYDTTKIIDINKIFKKGFSTKKIKSGVGLWETNLLIKKNKNSQLFTDIHNDLFVQTLIIEDIVQD